MPNKTYTYTPASAYYKLQEIWLDTVRRVKDIHGLEDVVGGMYEVDGTISMQLYCKIPCNFDEGGE